LNTHDHFALVATHISQPDQEASADKEASATGPTGSESPLVSLMAKRRLSFQAATYKAFSYEDLCKPIPPAGVDKARKEQYLSPQEFESLFGCTKEEFQVTQQKPLPRFF